MHACSVRRGKHVYIPTGIPAHLVTAATPEGSLILFLLHAYFRCELLLWPVCGAVGMWKSPKLHGIAAKSVLFFTAFLDSFRKVLSPPPV